MSGPEVARRIEDLPPYLFAEIDKKRAALIRAGKDLIDLGVGDPDLPTPSHIVEALRAAAAKPRHHRYPSYEGMIEFRSAVAGWYKTRFGVTLDPETEIVTLIGSKEGIAHLPLAFVNPGDVALVPSPGYPVYRTATLFCGGESHFLPLRRERGFLPDLAAVPPSVLARAKILFLNYPNNPTGATTDLAFHEEAAAFARRHGLLVCHDAAYSEMSYDGYRAPSFLEVAGAKEIAIEFHSLSKTYNMTGWRIGFAVGNRDAVAALGKVKTNVDSGVFGAVQEAGIAALTGDQAPVARMCEVYRERRDALVGGLRTLGLDVPLPKATFYVWIPVPARFEGSKALATHLLDNASIVATPGIGFGDAGDGYVRMALTAPVERIREAVERIRKAGI